MPESPLPKFYFSQLTRKYILKQPSFSKTLTDLRIGKKSINININININPIMDTTQQEQPPSPRPVWSISISQMVYLLGCLDCPCGQLVEVYNKMSGVQIQNSIFYIWMRKRSRLLKLDQQSGVYDVFTSVQAYNGDKPTYKIKVFTPSDNLAKGVGGLHGSMNNQGTIGDRNKDKDKDKLWKIAIVRNRDVVIFDVLN